MLYTVKGQSFDSPHTDEQAIEIISKSASRFALSLVGQYRRNGRLSDRQWPWVHKLAVDATTPEAEKPSVDVDCSAIFALFAHAMDKGMKRPRIIFPQAKFSLAGPHSRNAGSIHVAEGTYPGKYFGHITPEGKFVPGRNFGDLDMEFLSGFAADPKGYATSSGLELGSCRFCNLTLSTPESRSVGYGPKCASNWGLPWGKISN